MFLFTFIALRTHGTRFNIDIPCLYHDRVDYVTELANTVNLSLIHIHLKYSQ
jgi:hypothetical protein